MPSDPEDLPIEEQIEARRRECFWWRVGAGLLAWAVAASMLDRYLHWLDLLKGGM